MFVLIDGHNLIGKMPNISLSDFDDEEKLIYYVRRYQARINQNVIIFFDSGQNYNIGRKQTIGKITVIYAPVDKTADELIVNRLRKAKNPRQFLVVSSDRLIQREAKWAGAKVISSTKFAAQLNSLNTPLVDEGEVDLKADVNLSAEEVNEWLNFFNQQQE